MAQLSAGQTMVGVAQLVPAEVNVAVARILEPTGPTAAPPRPFGIGMAHAFGLAADWVTARFDDQRLRDAHVPAPLIDRTRKAFVDMMEFGLLAHQQTSPELDELMQKTRDGMRAVSQRFADAQVDLLKQLRAGGNMHRLAEAVMRTDFVDVIHDFNIACLSRGIVPQPTWGEDEDFVESMLRAIPSKWAVRQLRLARLRNPQIKYSGNDLNDVNALSLAVVYCDVVVTELNRQRADGKRRSGLSR